MLNLRSKKRRGAAIPAFAATCPLIVIFCGFGINLAYIQLCKTEMKIAVDVAAHAGGRRMGTPPRDTQGNIIVETAADAKAAIRAKAKEIAAMNSVAGRPVVLGDEGMEFGRSRRESISGTSRMTPYQWYETIDDDSKIPSSFRVVGLQNNVPLIFGPVASYGIDPEKTFKVSGNSTVTQVDRDVVLVLDRSGSMIYFENETGTNGLRQNMDALRNATYTTSGEDVYEYRVIYSFNGTNWYYSARYSNYLTEAEYASSVAPYDESRNDLEYQLYQQSRRLRSEGSVETNDKITEDEYQDGIDSLYDRWFTDNVVYWLERDNNENHQLGESPELWASNLSEEDARALLTVPVAIYCYEYTHFYKKNDKNINWHSQISSRRAPMFSRWYYLEKGVSVFLNVLGGGVDPDGTNRDGTVQKEQIAILPFNAAPDTIEATYGGVSYDDENDDFDYGLQGDGFPSAYANTSGDPGYSVPHEGSSLSLRAILPTVCPYGGTAIGESLQEAVYILRNSTSEDSSARARPFAAKTIVVLTDGDNTVGRDPVAVARDELIDEDVIVQTITFTTGVSSAGRTAMGDVAEYGRGRHYHTDNADALGGIFEEIANNLPTILTQ